jgi:hypothetical protein
MVGARAAWKDAAMSLAEHPPITAPPSGPAIAFAPTRAGLGHHRARAGRALGAGVLTFLTGSLLITVAGVLGMMVAVGGLVAAGVGVFGLATNMRFRRKLEHEPWRAWPCHVALTSSGPAFVLDQPNGQHHLLVASMVKPRYPIALRCAAGTLWFRRTGCAQVPGVGFEPTRPRGQRILSPPCLPFHHPGWW